MTIWQVILNFLVQTGLRLLLGAVILVAGWYLIKLIISYLKNSNRIKNSKTLSKADPTIHGFFISFVAITLRILLIVAVIGILGFPLTGILTVLATAGLAIGLAFQGALSNLAGGLMILFAKPFKVGDYIDNGGGQEGRVEAITVFYTKIVTNDNKLITVPNKHMTEKAIVNFYGKDTRRMDFSFKVAASSDIEKVKQLLISVAQSHPLTLKEPVPFCRLASSANNVLEFTLRVWVNNDDYWDLYYDLTENVKNAFDKEGIK